MIDIRRRRILAGLATGVGVSGVGCLGAVDYPRHRDLGFNEIELLDQSDSGYTIRVTPEMSWAGESEEWATFNDVRLAGYSESDGMLCEAKLGDLVGRGAMEPVTLTGEELPHVLRYEADETPCDEDTLIEKAVLVGRSDGEPTWRIGDEQCNE